MQQRETFLNCKWLRYDSNKEKVMGVAFSVFMIGVYLKYDVICLAKYREIMIQCDDNKEKAETCMFILPNTEATMNEDIRRLNSQARLASGGCSIELQNAFRLQAAVHHSKLFIPVKKLDGVGPDLMKPEYYHRQKMNGTPRTTVDRIVRHYNPNLASPNTVLDDIVDARLNFMKRFVTDPQISSVGARPEEAVVQFMPTPNCGFTPGIYFVTNDLQGTQFVTNRTRGVGARST